MQKSFKEPDDPRSKRRVKEVIHHTKKLTKAELKGIVKDILRETIREELVNFMNTNLVMRTVISDEFYKYTNTRDFQLLLQRITEEQYSMTKKLIDETIFDKMVELDQAKRSKRKKKPTLSGPRSRKVRL